MAGRGDQHRVEASLVSISELLHQIETNRKHFELHVSTDTRLCKRLGHSVSSAATRSSSSSSPPTTRESARPTPTGSSSSSPRTRRVSAPPTPTSGLATELPPVRAVDVDPDTFMLLCCPFPVIKLQAIRRKVCTWFRNLVWQRPPLPCVMTTCGPISHVRSCEFHPLTGALPYKKPVRRSLSLPQ